MTALTLLGIALQKSRIIKKVMIPAMVGASLLLASCGGSGGGDDAISGSINLDQPTSVAPQFTDVVTDLRNNFV